MSFRVIRHVTPDGLSLHARDHGPETGGLTPVVCLPGLTRNAKDFEVIAPRLAQVRRVVAVDFRGRGQSQYAADKTTYRPDAELADTLGLMDHLGIGRAAVIGTSRGGIVTMVMAAKARDRLAGAVLNDIGPRLDSQGLLRIRSLVGADPNFASWQAAAEALVARNPGFDSLSGDERMAFARRVFRDENGLPRADYDAALTDSLPSTADIEAGQLPELWDLFDLLIGIPTVVLRGEHSDLLSAETVTEMQARHPALTTVTVADRGHVPFLDEPECVEAIDGWLAVVDAREMGRQ